MKVIYKYILSFQTNGGEKARFEKVHGSCVVCGLSYVMEQELWHHIDEYIKPPSLLVSLQWVCVSLSIQPTDLPQEEKEKGKVCVNMSVYFYKLNIFTSLGQETLI